MDVVSAAILRGGRILLQQRSPHRDYPMTWETPGGKVESTDRTPRHALIRELGEELNWGWDAKYQENSGIIDMKPLYEFHLGMDVKVRFRFYQVTPWEWWRPVMLDAVGLGWFTHDEALRLDLTPGTLMFLNNVVFPLRKPNG